MEKPLIFVSIEGRSLIERTLKHIISTLAEASVVEQLVEGEAEADIAVTNSIATALRWVKETEQTTIVVAYLLKDEREQAVALAGRFPTRVYAVPFAGRSATDNMEIVPFLLKLIAEKGTEVAQ